MRSLAIASLLSAALALPAFADQAQNKTDAASGTTSAQSAALAEGEVRKVDKEANKITIKHGPLSNLDMPAMTMVFQVKDPALLDKVKAGDKVKFQAEKAGGAFTVTQIEPAK
jgi:Cu(I)/Ag(I) efflux system protein CusF